MNSRAETDPRLPGAGRVVEPIREPDADGIVDCQDCQVPLRELDAFTITPPLRADGRSCWWLCPDCWDRIIDDAILARLR